MNVLKMFKSFFVRLFLLSPFAFSMLPGDLNSSWIYLFSAYAEDGDGGDEDIVDDSPVGCKDAGVLSGKMITSIPWNAIYPIKVAGVKVINKGREPSGAAKSKICSCPDAAGFPHPGLTNALWEPARLVELVREPGCFMGLAGAEMGVGDKRNKGVNGIPDNDPQRSRLGQWHYHYYAYPLLLMLEVWYPGRCADGYLDYDILYMSEVDPMWNDVELAHFVTPEATLFANPVAIGACATDAIAATAGRPIDSLYWCAGAWGNMYPFAGVGSETSDTARNTSLLGTKAVAGLHRKLMARKTMGDDTLCRPQIYPTIPKSQYKMSLFWPVPETKSAHVIGESTFNWGLWRQPAWKKDSVYTLWRWQDCCNTMID